MLKTIVLKLNDQEYGINIEQVLSIEKSLNITEIPKTSDFIKGVIELRGDLIPIIDLKERLEIGKTTVTNNTRILIVKVHHLHVGLIVDSATDVLDIDPDVIEPAPKIVTGVDTSFIHGVAKLENNLLIILNLDYILNNAEVAELANVHEG